MAIPSKQIGWGTEEKLLWQISKQLESLTGVTYNSKKTLLNVASGTDAGAKIETFSGAITGVEGDTIFTVDLNQIQGGVIEYSAYWPNGGQGVTGTYWFTGSLDGGKFVQNATITASGNEIIYRSMDGSLVSFTLGFGGGDTVQMVYTVKLFTVPLYNA
jgi:hypothetical protein